MEMEKQTLNREFERIKAELNEIQNYKNELLSTIQQNQEKSKHECRQILQRLNEYKQKYEDKTIEMKRIREQLEQMNAEAIVVQHNLHQKQFENDELCQSHQAETEKNQKQIQKLEHAVIELTNALTASQTKMEEYKQLTEALKRDHSLILEIEHRNNQQ